MSNIQNVEKYNLLFGLMGIDEKNVRDFKEQFNAYGVVSDILSLKYNKIGINQYLAEQGDIDVLIVSEYLESIKPYTIKDYSYILDKYENILLIPIIMQHHKSDNYVKEIYQLGLYNAIFEEDASLENIAKIILKRRTRKEARLYYGIDDSLMDNVGADITKCREYISLTDDVQEMMGRAQYIKTIVTEREFVVILSGLSEHVKNEFSKIEDFMPYLEPNKNTQVNIDKINPHKKRFNKIPIPVPVFHKRSKEDVVKEKVDLSNVVSNVLIGFIGIQSRVGTTHHAITTAHFLAKRNYKVAILEINEINNKSFDLLAQYLNMTEDETTFTYENVDYYKEFEFTKINTLYSKKYNFIIVDFGTYCNTIKNDFIRCVLQIVVASYSPWEKRLLQIFIKNVTNDTTIDNLSFIIQGVSHNQEKEIEDLELPENRVFYSEYNNGIFTGEGYDGLQQLLKLYLIEPITYKEEKKKFFPLSFPVTKRASVKVRSKQKVEMRGTGVVFLTSLKHGTGCSHLGIAISNYLRRTMSNKVCFINQNSGVVLNQIDSSIDSVEDEQNYAELYSSHDYLIFDRGIFESLKSAELVELRRADYKIMMCLSDDDYLNRLSIFIQEYGAGIKDWIFMFNILPKGKEDDIKHIMRGYKSFYLPPELFDAASVPPAVQTIFSKVF